MASASTTTVGLLEAGAPPGDLSERFGSYGQMVQRLLGTDYSYVTYDVRRGELPAPGDCNAYVVTGSASGVYDDEGWIEPLMAFVREVWSRAPLVGICFGHQLMAQALGGRVIKSPKGWGIGLHTYEIWRRTEWMDEARSIAVVVSHQDQVVEPPAGAAVLAGSAFTPFGVLAYPQGRALSFQFHPEFSPGYAAALIELRRGSTYDVQLSDEAIASLRAPNDSRRVASWIRRFITSAQRA